jgi:hypothetical protein
MNQVFAWAVVHDSLEGDDAAPPGLRRRPLAPVLVYAAASTLGGALAAVALYAFGSALRGALGSAVATVIAAAVALLAVAADAMGRQLLPERAAQVPRRWTTWSRPTATAAAFGSVLGAGAFTYLHRQSAYVAAAFAAAAPSLAIAVLIGVSYGAAKAAVLGVNWYQRGGDLDQSWVYRLAARTHAVVPLMGLVAVGAATVALAE